MRGSVEDVLAGATGAEPLFRAVERAVAALADVRVVVGKSQIAFKRRRTFAAVWVPGRYVRSDAPLVLTVYLHARDPSPRWKQVVEPAPGRFTHHLELRSPAQVDDEVGTWLRRAWGDAR